MANKRNSSVVRFVIGIIWPFKWYLLAQMGVMLFWALYISVNAYLVKRMIDVASTSNLEHVVSNILPYVFMYFGSLVAIFSAYRIHGWFHLRSMPRIEQEVIDSLSEKLLTHSYQFYQEQFSGALANNIRTVATNVPKILELLIDKIFRPLITVIVAIFTVSRVSGLFGFALGVWFVIFLGIIVYAAPHLRRLRDITAELNSKVVGQLVDMIGNMLSVRLFSEKQYELTRIDESASAAARSEQDRLWFFVKLLLAQSFLYVLYVLAILWLLVRGLKTQHVTGGDFALVLMINETTGNVMWRMAQDFASFSEMWGSITQGLRTIMQAPDVQDVPHATKLSVSQGEIVYDAVSFSYQGKKDFFERLTITIHPGQRVGLVGYSGSGKSTFVHLLLRLFDLDSGEILIDGQNIAEVTQDSLRHAISFIPQDPSLFHRSLYENILYARPEASEQDIINAAKRAHAHEFIVTTAHGYQTLVGERGVKLSGGQRQRIAIARAFLKDGPILILDEATSQLDSVTEAYIQESLWELMAGKTVLVIAHRLATLLHMDRILVFDKGQIVEDGTHAELLQRNGLYKSLWDHQIGGFLPDTAS
jgi:ATP-binding cassette, subfamily B, bacterial